MVPVYLCEDDNLQLAHLEKIIRNEIMINELDMSIAGATLSPYKLLSQISKEKLKNAAYFLDIELKCDMDGFQLALEIRKHDPRAFIIFITTHDEMLTTTFQYRVEPLDFIIKDSPDFRQRIVLSLSSVMDKYNLPDNTSMDTLPIISGKRTIILRKNDIYFIESILQSHKIAVHTSKEVFETISTLKEIAEKLDERFTHSHKAYIVNCNHVISLNHKDYTVVFENHLTCPCATRQYTRLFKKLNLKDKPELCEDEETE